MSHILSPECEQGLFSLVGVDIETLGRLVQTAITACSSSDEDSINSAEHSIEGSKLFFFFCFFRISICVIYFWIWHSNRLIFFLYIIFFLIY